MSIYGERLPDETIQWFAMLRYEESGRIDGLVPEEDLIIEKCGQLHV